MQLCNQNTNEKNNNFIKNASTLKDMNFLIRKHCSKCRILLKAKMVKVVWWKAIEGRVEAAYVYRAIGALSGEAAGRERQQALYKVYWY